MRAVRGLPGRTSGTSCSAAPTSTSRMCSGTARSPPASSRTGASIVYAAALDAALGVLAVPGPAAAHLALAPATNPARDALELQLSAADAGDVRVTLFDVSGRVRAERMLAGPARARTLRFD